MSRVQAPPEAAGQRLDAWLAQALPELSRARWQQLTRAGHVRVAGRLAKVSHALRGGETIDYEVPPPVPAAPAPEDIPLAVVFEDADLLVINKPAGLVVHPAPGHAGGTLVNALLYHCADLAGIGGEIRPGIVHRLDKDTSGLLVVAKTEPALHGLAAQFKSHAIHKMYWALVHGVPASPSGEIHSLIGRSDRDRKKMSAQPSHGRPAETRYTVLERFADAALLEVVIATGRTHQIRVHLAFNGHPVVGDQQYGGRRAQALALAAPRQMLHARRLGFTHPRLGIALEFEAPLPPDFSAVIAGLRGGNRCILPASPLG